MVVERAVTAELVNIGTGELIQLHEGDYIHKVHVKDKYSSRVSAETNGEPMYLHMAGTYKKAYDFGLKMLSKDKSITGNEYRLLFTLLPYMKENSGICFLKGNKEITVDWIAEQMEIAPLTARNVLLRLKSRGIIHYGSTSKTRTIYINPFLFYNGRYISQSIEDMFRSTPYYIEYMKSIKDKKKKSASSGDGDEKVDSTRVSQSG
jgi:predicted transcriptional regulator